NASLVARGLVRAGRAAVEGDLGAAGVEALAALVAPAAVSCSAVATLVTEVVGGASELAGDALDGASAPLPDRCAAWAVLWWGGAVVSTGGAPERGGPGAAREPHRLFHLSFSSGGPGGRAHPWPPGPRSAC